MINDVNVSTPQIAFSKAGFAIQPFSADDGCDICIQHTFAGQTRAWYEYDKPIRLFLYSGHQQILLFDGRDDSSTYGAMQELWSGMRNPLLIDIPINIVFGWKNIEAGDSLLHIPQGAVLKQHPADTHLIPFSWDDTNL